jgi:hypothetical protein
LVEVGHRGRLSAFPDQLPFRSNHMRTSCKRLHRSGLAKLSS